ncbi:MAG TPA: hypothetical protein EYG80_01550 [Flavobacteriaceae bacterium]|nr:hypothetical protein [Flavobacteriaceae bacterium]
MNKVLITLVLVSQVLISTQISNKVDDENYKTSSSVYLKPTQKLKMRFNVKDAKSIKWYQIIPNTSKFYKNANHPWEKNPYQWSDYGKIEYNRVEIKSFENGRW